MKMLSDEFDGLLRGGERLRFRTWPEEQFIYLVDGRFIERKELRDNAINAMRDCSLPGRGDAEPLVLICPHVDKYIGEGRLLIGWVPNPVELLGEWEVYQAADIKPVASLGKDECSLSKRVDRRDNPLKKGEERFS